MLSASKQVPLLFFVHEFRILGIRLCWLDTERFKLGMKFLNVYPSTQIDGRFSSVYVATIAEVPSCPIDLFVLASYIFVALQNGLLLILSEGLCKAVNR